MAQPPYVTAHTPEPSGGPAWDFEAPWAGQEPQDGVASVRDRIHGFEAAQPGLGPSGDRIADATADRLWDRRPPELNRDPPAENPLRAVRPGDGVRKGRTSEDIRRNVRQLQELLRTRLPAEIPIDGCFWVGNGSLQAWEDWTKSVNRPLDLNAAVDQVAIDLLVQGNRKGKEEPDPIRPGPDHAALEVVLDRIDVAYQNMVTRQRDGVQAVIRDLTPLDRVDPAMWPGLLKGLLQGPLIYLYGIANGALRRAINVHLQQDPDLAGLEHRNLDGANDKLFDGLAAAGLEFITGLADIQDPADGKLEERQDLLARFADEQLALVTQLGFAAHDHFEQQKPQMRKPVKGAPPPNCQEDPRVCVAKAELRAVNHAASVAFHEQYHIILQRWSVALGRNSGLRMGRFGGGTQDRIDPATGRLVIGKDGRPEQEARESLDLRPLRQGGGLGRALVVPGVLYVGMWGRSPGAPISLKDDARISGMSPRTRKKLSGPVGQLGVPVVAEGKFHLPGAPIPQPPDWGPEEEGRDAHVAIGINEARIAFNLTTDDDGREWRKRRGGGDEEAGKQRLAEDLGRQTIGGVDKGGG
jgi:hypothetical protein